MGFDDDPGVPTSLNETAVAAGVVMETQGLDADEARYWLHREAFRWGLRLSDVTRLVLAAVGQRREVLDQPARPPR